MVLIQQKSFLLLLNVHWKSIVFYIMETLTSNELNIFRTYISRTEVFNDRLIQQYSLATLEADIIE